MLAGIFSGDWGVAESTGGAALVDQAKTRDHLIQILAHWPESSEADFIRHNLRWDDSTGENQFEYMPRVHESAVKRMVET